MRMYVHYSIHPSYYVINFLLFISCTNLIQRDTCGVKLSSFYVEEIKDIFAKIVDEKYAFGSLPN